MGDDREKIRAMLMDETQGSWEGNTYTPRLSAIAELDDPMNLVKYFDEHGGDNRLHLP